MIRIYIFLLFVITFSGKLAGQVTLDTNIYEIKLFDGQLLKGKIIEETTKEITLDSDILGLISVQHSDIVSIKIFREKGYYSKTIQSLYRSRYFITESAFMPDQGELYIENKAYLMTGLGIGVSKNVSVDVNALLVPGDIRGASLFANFGIKVGHSFNKYIHAAFRYNYTIKNNEESLYRNYLVGYLTLGEPKKNITLGYSRLGYYGDYITTNFIRKHEKLTAPAYVFGANIDFTTRTNFKFEHAFIPNSGGITALGFGWNGSFMLINYGFILPLLDVPDDESGPIPYVSFTIHLSDLK